MWHESSVKRFRVAYMYTIGLHFTVLQPTHQMGPQIVTEALDLHFFNLLIFKSLSFLNKHWINTAKPKWLIFPHCHRAISPDKNHQMVVLLSCGCVVLMGTSRCTECQQNVHYSFCSLLHVMHHVPPVAFHAGHFFTRCKCKTPKQWLKKLLAYISAIYVLIT